jgi:hypothetical protein
MYCGIYVTVVSIPLFVADDFPCLIFCLIFTHNDFTTSPARQKATAAIP